MLRVFDTSQFNAAAYVFPNSGVTGAIAASYPKFIETENYIISNTNIYPKENWTTVAKTQCPALINGQQIQEDVCLKHYAKVNGVTNSVYLSNAPAMYFYPFLNMCRGNKIANFKGVSDTAVSAFYTFDENGQPTTSQYLYFVAKNAKYIDTDAEGNDFYVVNGASEMVASRLLTVNWETGNSSHRSLAKTLKVPKNGNIATPVEIVNVQDGNINSNYATTTSIIYKDDAYIWYEVKVTGANVKFGGFNTLFNNANVNTLVRGLVKVQRANLALNINTIYAIFGNVAVGTNAGQTCIGDSASFYHNEFGDNKIWVYTTVNKTTVAAGGEVKPQMARYILDLDNPVANANVTIVDDDIDLNGFEEVTFPVSQGVNLDGKWKCDLEAYTNNENGKHYVFKHINAKANDLSGIQIFEVIPDDMSLKLVSQITIPNYMGYIPIESDLSKILVYGQGNARVYSLNKTTMEYSMIQQVTQDFAVVGVDMQKNIWFFNMDNSVDLMGSGNLATELVYQWDDASTVEYNGEDITRHYLVKLENSYRELKAGNLKLQITGPATFENGETTINVTTNTEGWLSVPVTIKGGYDVYIQASLLSLV